MKRYILGLFIVAVICIAETISAADIQIQTGFHYDWWKDSKDNKGSQAYIPIRIEGQQKDFTLGVLTAYTFTDFSPSSGGDRSIDTLVDTTLTTSYAIVGKLPVDILIG